MMAHLNLPAANIQIVKIDGCARVTFAELIDSHLLFQRDTLIAVADAMETGARQLELTKAVLTPDDLREQAVKLRTLAEQLSPGGVADATGVPA
jgi:hypothetical protein